MASLPRIVRTVSWCVCAAALTIVAGCGGATDQASRTPTAAGSNARTTAARTPAAVAGYPSSIVALGDALVTGQDSDPSRPDAPAPANSWVIGTNPAVNSVYRRILAHNPAIKGRAFSFAQSGTSMFLLPDQAKQAIAVHPTPELVVIGIIDSAIQCPLSKSDLATFATTLRSALKVLTSGAPHAKIFVVGSFAGIVSYARALTVKQRQAQRDGADPCEFVAADGRIVLNKATRLVHAINAYETRLKQECDRFTRCRYDGGAFGDIVEKPAYISRSLNDLSVQGDAKAAAVAWAAMQHAGLVPRS
jgi:hypothetical protein